MWFLLFYIKSILDDSNEKKWGDQDDIFVTSGKDESENDIIAENVAFFKRLCGDVLKCSLRI